MNDTITIYDIFASIILILFLMLIAGFYQNSKKEKHTEYSYYRFGLITKIAGAIALAFIYVYYYGGGDTQMYFHGGSFMNNVFFSDKEKFFQLFFSERDKLPVSLQTLAYKITYSSSNEEWFMIKITSIVNLFAFNRFLISSILFSLIAFYGSWKLYQTFLFFSPESKKAGFYAVFLLPSVIFWSSGILKDTITFASLGLFFYHFVKLFIKFKINIISVIFLIITSLIIFKLKAYILIGFTPALFIMLFIYYKDEIKNNIIRKLLSPLLFIIMISVGYLLVLQIMNDSNKYRIDTLQSRIEGFHTWHTTQGGSSYDLGKVEYTPIGILKKVPQALNVTFFRPYLWEARNITSLVGAIESSVLLGIFLYLLYLYRLKWLIVSFSDSFLALSLIYSIVFGFAVGFTSYNFGALARYKVPVMPFFTFLLLYFLFSYKKTQKY